MPTLDTIDLIVADVPAATAFFRDGVGLTVHEAGERFAALGAGAVTLMLSPDAMVPVRPAAGVILHVRVESVEEAVARARRVGATILMPPSDTEWGWRSALVAGPEGSIVDFYRPLAG